MTKKLTKLMEAAGIVDIHGQNTNSSFQCPVRLEKILGCELINPRKFDRKHANTIKADWFLLSWQNPRLRFDGRNLSAINGNHSIKTALEMGIEVATCDVHFGIDTQTAARIFHDLTVNSKQIGVWVEHQAALLAGLPLAVAIQTTVDEFGLSTPLTKNRADADLTSYTPLKEAQQCGVLDRLLAILSEVYSVEPKGVDKIARGCEFQRGLIDLLRLDLTDWTTEEIVSPSGLAKDYASEVWERASEHAAEDFRRSPTRFHYHQAFVDVINRPRRRAA